MSEKPYVPFYTSDFLGGTGGMTAATKGVYITLLCIMYEHEAPLGQSWDSLARRCGCTLPAFKKAVNELEADRKIEVSDEGIWSQKCEKHITARRERQSSAKAAAEKRWEKSKQNQRQEDATAMRPQCQPEPEPEPVKRDTNVSLAQPEADASATIDRSRFADFWAMVPRKIGKKATEAAWKRLSRADQDAAKDSVTAWYRWFQSTHRDATPLYPERYLKHRRWEDEGWQDKPKAAPDRDAAIAIYREHLTSKSDAVRRNAEDQLRKLGVNADGRQED